MKKLVVKVRFADINDMAKLYEVDDVVSFDDEKRVESLISRGLCEAIDGDENKDDNKAEAKINIFGADYEKQEIIAALKACDVKVAVNISAAKLVEQINELGVETAEKLQKILVKQ